MTQSNKLKIAILTSTITPDQEALIAELCALPNIQTVAVLIDTEIPSLRQRLKHLRRNVRREGVSYVFFRTISMLRHRLESWAERVIPPKEVDQLLKSAFPNHRLDRIAEQYGLQIHEVGNLNAPLAIERLRAAGADLGVVLRTRILKRSLFSVPRLGCINLHKGSVPDYRGLPPGFWELFDSQESAGVTVHFVDDGLDTGDIIGQSTVPIHAKETPESLRKKLDMEGARLLAAVLEQVARGTAQRQPQPPSTARPRTRPTRAQQNELARRLPHWRRLREGREALKLAFWLILFHSGVFSLLRASRRGKSRGAILLYHRVNDVSTDVLTCSTRRFAEHLVTLRHYYRLISTEELVDKIATRKRVEPTTVAVHFDDCYRDVRGCAAPLLAAAGIPATAFVASGFVDTERIFLHDQTKYPHHFENFRASDLRDLQRYGIGIAAHTVNHVDLGTVALEQAQMEVIDSREQLENLIGRPVLLFSFPFGGIHNIRDEVREIVVAAGYRALFSAHGGFVNQSTQLFDVPRIGVSSDHSPLALMMELEGLSLGNLYHGSRHGKGSQRAYDSSSCCES